MLCYGYSHVLELSTAGTIRVRTRPKISCCPNLFFFSRICHVFVYHFVCFYELFPPISDLIDLARWVKLNT